MKLTKAKLKQIIKEELNEASADQGIDTQNIAALGADYIVRQVVSPIEHSGGVSTMPTNPELKEDLKSAILQVIETYLNVR